jgi:hypothetical protein
LRLRFLRANHLKITTKCSWPKAQALRIGTRFSLKSSQQQTTMNWTDSLSLLPMMFLTMVSLLWCLATTIWLPQISRKEWDPLAAAPFSERVKIDKRYADQLTRVIRL